MGRESSSGRGRGRSRYGGRGRGRFNANSKKTSTMKEYKFYPHTVGSQQQSVTFDTVKDHIVQFVQKTYKNGIDIAESLDKEVIKDLTPLAPTRKISVKPNAEEKALEQSGFDIEFKVQVEEHIKRAQQLEENKTKAYALIFSNYCNRVMQLRIEEHVDYETKIKNDPIELLKAIRVLMHDPARAKYPFASMTESLLRVMQYTKQQEGENLIDYVTRFKSSKNVAKSHVGSEILHKFIEHTEDYRKETDATKKQQMKTESFDNWMAYLLMRNSDQKKYGSLITGLSSQYSMGNNQYPKTITAATDILANHKHDNYDSKKKNNKNKTDGDKKPEKEEEKEDTSKESSFAQSKVICYCCGKEDHKSPDCPDKDKIPKDQWFQKKASQAYQNYLETISEKDKAEKDTSKKVGWMGLQLAASHLHQEYSMAAKFMGQDMSKCFVLDNGSSLDLIGNEDLVENVRKSNSKLLLATNAGAKEVDTKATIPEHGDVWFDPNAIANIFSLKNMVKKHRVTFDSEKEDAFLVHTKQNGIIKFEATPQGLYAYKVPETYIKSLDKSETSNIMSTVAKNRMNYTERQFERAKLARKLYHNVGTPTVKNFKLLLKANMIANCPVTTEDVDITEKIFGPSMSSLKGKSTRSKPKIVRKDVIEIPRELIEKHREIELCMDTMFINNEGLLTSIDREIRFRACIPINSKKKEEYFRALDVILRKYNSAGFIVRVIQCDGEYRSMMDEVKDELDVDMNYANAFDHVPEAERNNRTIKDRFRAAYHRMPFKKIPRVMIRYLAMVQTDQLNYFPAKGGISSYYSPTTILGGPPLDYNKHCVIPFGAYVQANHESNPTNDNTARTIDCIYLRPCKNQQGGHELMDLNSGRVITRGGKITEIPITNVVIKAVEAMAEREGFKSLKFKNRHGVVFFDTDWIAGVDYHTENPDNIDYEEEEDADYEPEDEVDQDDDDEQEEIDQNDIDELLAETEESNPMEQQDKEQDQDEDQEDEVLVEDVDEDEDEDPDPDPEPIPETRRSTRERREVDRLEPTMQGKTYLQAAKEGNNKFVEPKVCPQEEKLRQLEYRYNLVCQVSPNPSEDVEYGYDFAMLIARTMNDINQKVTMHGASFIQQYILKKGLQKFGERGAAAATKEMDQLHRRNCFTPISIADMTPLERKRAMEALMFLAEKRDGMIKGRCVYNGKETRKWLTREDSASPTAAHESIIITAVINAKEERDVMCADLPNAFIQTEMPKIEEGQERVVMKITGVLVDMLVQLNPGLYADYVVYEKNRKVLYVQVLRAIYGMLQSSLLWYKKLRGDLEEIGFEFNPYDPCVANREQQGKQQTVVFHVDDLKSSHVNPKVNDKFAKWLEMKYGEHGKVKVHRGKIHDYLGMTFDYTEKGKVKIDMIPYVEDMLEEFPKKLQKNEVVATPAADNLFAKGHGKKLSADRGDIFHRIVAKGLFVSKRARPDIQPTIAGLCTRVKDPDESDWSKLVRLMKYLNGTRRRILTLSADNLHVIKWYVDASFAVHPDFKSHTGAAMTFGRGGAINISRKQKLNTKSSTDAELVGADDASVMILWTKLFIEHQGYEVEKNILYQDNKSAILLEVNGRKSAGKRSRALNVRYFFLTDQVEKGNLTIQYCPTDEMWGDFHSKPLQGEKFRRFGANIMGED